MKKRTEEEFTAGFGKMVKGKSSLLLEKDELSDTQNMQPGFGWKQRRGMSELTASAVATGLRFKSMIHFRTLDDTTNLLLAHTYDSTNGERILYGSALPPSAITWTEMYDLTASCEVGQWANVAKAVLYANDKEFLIWRGNSHKPSGIFFYKSSTSKYINYYDEMTDDDQATTMPLDSMVNGADAIYYIGEMPLGEIDIDLTNFNTLVSTGILYYWNGAWTQLEMGANMPYSDGSLYTADLTTNSGWTSQNSGTGVFSTNVTKDTLTPCYYMTNGATGGAGDWCRQIRDIGSFGTNTVIWTMRFKMNHPGGDQAMFHFDNGTYVMHMYIRKNECIIYNQSSYTAVYAGKIRDNVWHTMTCVADFDTLLADFWIDGELDETDVDISRTTGAGTDGSIFIDQHGDNDPNQEFWIREYKVSLNSAYSLVGDGYDDGTAVDTVGTPYERYPMGQDGTISWNPPADEIQTVIEGVPGFAYKHVMYGGLDSNCDIAEISVSSPIGEVQDVWDGMPRVCTGCYVYDGTSYADYTAFVNNMVEAQTADLSGATTSYALYVGFAERCTAVDVYIPTEEPNQATSAVDAIYYFNASGTATSVGTFSDTTKVGSKSFVQKGRLSWSDPGETSEKMTTIGGDSVPMYWYKIEWSATLTDPCGIYYIAGVPAGENPEACYGCFAYKRRAWQLAPHGDENAVRYSASNLPNVWNGDDSGYIYFGERPLRAAAPFYNETVIYADTEMWMLQGNTPTNFGRLRLSANIGISAPHSLVSVESGVNVNDSIKVLLTWQFNDGFWLFDGVRIWKISAPDIDSFFDPDHDDYINPTYLSRTYGTYDFTNQLVMWSVYSGSSATTPTKVLVLHVPTMWYGIFDYATDIGAMLSVINNKIYVVGGGFDNGKFYLLDTGKTDVDTSGTTTAVDAFVITQDMKVGWSDGIKQRLFSLWAESEEDGGFIEVDEYPDGLDTPVEVGKQSMTWLGKLFGAFQKNLKIYPSQKTSKFRIRNRSKNARMKLIGHSTTVDRGRSNE